ncbi:MAG: hypothetical protein U0414_16925 [Polyangiaceae bacterium]
MPNEMLHVGAVVQCVHGGMAQPSVPYPRVSAMMMPSTLQVAPYLVAGCSFIPLAGIGPCVTGMWVRAATRTTGMGIPFVIQGGTAVDIPTGTGLMPSVFQPRVQAR